MAHDIFISHSSKDKAVADATCACLESRGLRCWIAPRDIVAGAEWGASIIDGIQGSQAMVLILSSHSNISPQVLREIERAVNRSIPVLPFRIEDVVLSKSLEYFLSSAHWLDAYHGELKHHLDKLANNVAIVIDKQHAVRTLAASHEGAASHASPVVLREGQCKACGTVTSDLTKKFCRNPQCGASLRIACLQCDAQMPVWDGVCGECGGNQPVLLRALRVTLEAKRTEAESLLAALSFDEAIQIAKSLSSECRAELKDLVEWGTSFLSSATAEKEHRHSVVREQLACAAKFMRARNWPQLVELIESIPEPLRGLSFRDTGCQTPATALLDECNRHRAKASSIIADIRGRVRRKELDGLLELVEQALFYGGDRADLLKLRDQLVERDLLRFRRAQAAFEAGDMQAALLALPEIHRACTDDEYECYECCEAANLRRRIEAAAECDTTLQTLIKKAKKEGTASLETASEIVRVGEEFLSLAPHHTKVLALVKQAQGILSKRDPQYAQDLLRRRDDTLRREREREEILSRPPIRNSIGIDLRSLPGGLVTSETGPATVIQPFFLGVCKVTNAQWKRLMGTSPSTWQGDGHPVEQVTWHEATEFCKRLSEVPDERSAGRVYRLPTAAEWDYACCAGATPEDWVGHPELWIDYAWYQSNSREQTHPVGLKKPNPWGFYDIYGNVYEMCSDKARPSAAAPDDEWRVCRGSCMMYGPTGGYGVVLPSLRYSDTGFRLAMNLAEADSCGDGQSTHMDERIDLSGRHSLPGN